MKICVNHFQEKGKQCLIENQWRYSDFDNWILLLTPANAPKNVFLYFAPKITGLSPLIHEE